MAYTNVQKIFRIEISKHHTYRIVRSKRSQKKRQFKLLTLNDKRQSLQTTVLQAPDFGQAHAYDC